MTIIILPFTVTIILNFPLVQIVVLFHSLKPFLIKVISDNNSSNNKVMNIKQTFSTYASDMCCCGTDWQTLNAHSATYIIHTVVNMQYKSKPWKKSVKK